MPDRIDSALNWQSAFDAMEEAVCLVDLQGRIHSSNEAMAKFLGRSKEELTGQNCFGLMHGTDCPIHDCPVVRMAKSRKRERLVLEQNGRWYEAVADPYYDESGELIGAVHYLADITSHRKAEEELGRLRHEFLHVSRVSAMGELAATLAHELNQPLTSMLANAQAAQSLLAADPPNREEIRSAMEDIVSENRRAAEIIRRIRAMVSKGPRQFQLVNMDKLAEDVLALVRGLAMARRITVLRDVSSVLPTVRGDMVQLQQVVLNLALNAIEAMSAPEIRTRRLTLRLQPAGGGGLEVTVEDTGPGLQQDDINRIFTAFYTTKPEGMGMGLPICCSILEQHGTCLRASNRPEGGARFQFSLPAAADYRT